MGFYRFEKISIENECGMEFRFERLVTVPAWKQRKLFSPALGKTFLYEDFYAYFVNKWGTFADHH
jgi:hypothetical protein